MNNIKIENVYMAVSFLIGMVLVCNLNKLGIMEGFKSVLDSSKLYKTHIGSGCQSRLCKESDSFRHSINYKKEIDISDQDCGCKILPSKCKSDILIEEENITRPVRLSDEEELKLLQKYIEITSTSNRPIPWKSTI
jgi:hypothetical protein